MSSESRINACTDLIGQLTQKSWAVSDRLVDSGLVQELLRLCQSASLRPAKIGRTDGERLLRDIRNDEIFWLERGHAHASEQKYFALMDEFAQQLNQELYLGIRAYECHYARYSAGGFYQKHLDQHRGQHSRAVSTLLYLNPNWQPADGGRLLIYNEKDTNKVESVVEPVLGRFVCFLSDRLYHEVETSHAARLSLTGWLRRG